MTLYDVTVTLEAESEKDAIRKAQASEGLGYRATLRPAPPAWMTSTTEEEN